MDKKFSGNPTFIIAIGEVICLCVLGTALFFEQFQTSRIQFAYSLSDGVSTCFSRLGQTYTAGLLKLNHSIYLTDEFIKQTEECFGESMISLEEALSQKTLEQSDGITQLPSAVHWFHEKMKSGPSVLTDTKDFNGQINSRYTKLEGNRNEVLEVLGKIIENDQDNLAYTRPVVYFFGLLFIVLSGLFIFYELKSFRKYRKIEQASMVELFKGNQFNCEEASSIISEGLSNYQLSLTRDVFFKLMQNLTSGRKDIQTNVGVVLHDSREALKQELVVPAKSIRETVEDNDTLGSFKGESKISIPVEISNLDNVPLDDVVGNVIDQMASYLFTRGVFLDLDIDDNLWVKMSREVLEHVTFQIISYLSQEVKDMESSKRITIRAKNVSGRVQIQFHTQNHVFSAQVLEMVNSDFIIDNPELQIIKELMSESNSDTTFTNISSPDSHDLHGMIELNLEAGTKEKHLAGLKKGKKKDLMKDMST